MYKTRPWGHWKENANQVALNFMALKAISRHGMRAAMTVFGVRWQWHTEPPKQYCLSHGGSEIFIDSSTRINLLSALRDIRGW